MRRLVPGQTPGGGVPTGRLSRMRPRCKPGQGPAAASVGSNSLGCYAGPMLIYIDETGDLGFDFTKQATSRYFVITALVLPGHPQQRDLKFAVNRTLKNKVN